MQNLSNLQTIETLIASGFDLAGIDTIVQESEQTDWQVLALEGIEVTFCDIELVSIFTGAHVVEFL